MKKFLLAFGLLAGVYASKASAVQIRLQYIGYLYATDPYTALAACQQVLATPRGMNAQQVQVVSPFSPILGHATYYCYGTYRVIPYGAPEATN